MKNKIYKCVRRRLAELKVFFPIKVVKPIKPDTIVHFALLNKTSALCIHVPTKSSVLVYHLIRRRELKTGIVLEESR